MRLEAPLQSWGTQNSLVNRDTDRVPSKSGVIGILCAALGMKREDDAMLAELAPMRMGVRVDREGIILSDFHVVGGGKWKGRKYGVAQADGNVKYAATITRRDYLADASFLVGLESDDKALLHRCNEALKSPRWPLFLGRKACVPGKPIHVGIRDDTLERALTTEPRVHSREKQDYIRMVIETSNPKAKKCIDQPLSFASDRRRFAPRYVETKWIESKLVPLEEGEE